MTGYEYFEQVLKDKGLKAYDVSKGTGIRSGVFSDWKKGRYTPKADKMQKIADFLGVPVEPLLVENIKNLAFAEINEGKDKEKPDHEKQIESLERKIERLKDLYVNELITLDEYKHDVASYKADIERFRKDMRKYANADKSALKSLVGMNLEDWYWTLTVAEKRTLWLGVIDKIWYGDDKQIRVDFLVQTTPSMWIMSFT